MSIVETIKAGAAEFFEETGEKPTTVHRDLDQLRALCDEVRVQPGGCLRQIAGMTVYVTDWPGPHFSTKTY